MSRVSLLLMVVGLLSHAAMAQPQPSVKLMLPGVIDALEARSVEDLHRFTRDEASFDEALFAPVAAIDFSAVKTFAAQVYRVFERPGTPAYELLVIFEKADYRGEDALGEGEPWRVDAMHKRRTKAPLTLEELAPRLERSAEGSSGLLPEDDHEFQFEDFIRRVSRGEDVMRRFLRANGFEGLSDRRLVPADETYYLLDGLGVRYRDGHEAPAMLLLAFVGTPAPGWYVTDLTLDRPAAAVPVAPARGPAAPAVDPAAPTPSSDLPEALRLLVGDLVARTGLSEDAALDLLFSFREVIDGLELDLNRVADPRLTYEARRNLIPGVLDAYFTSPTAPVEISSTRNRPLLTRPVERYLQLLSRVRERYGYVSVTISFDLGFEFYDIEPVRRTEGAYEAAVVVYQVFEARTADGSGYKDVTKKKLHAFLSRTESGLWDIRFTRIGVEDTYAPGYYFDNIRPRLTNSSSR